MAAESDVRAPQGLGGSLLASSEPLTTRTMAALWGRVKTIIEIRATRAESWGNQSILAACKQQLQDLDALVLDSLQMLYAFT